MGKYLLKRLLHGIFSIIVVVAIVMVLIFSLLDRGAIFATDPVYSKKAGNQKTVYEYQQWEKYGYVEFVLYNEFINEQIEEGNLTEEEGTEAKALGLTAADDAQIVTDWIQKFTETYEALGYDIVRLNGKTNSKGVIVETNRQNLYAVKDLSLGKRLLEFFGSIITVDTVHYVKSNVENRGIKFTFFDPLAGGKFSPAIIGNGTQHKYLLYFDSSFPFIHQNLVTFHIGKSYSMYQGNDLVEVMTSNQGAAVVSTKTSPTGKVVETAYDFHSATYSNSIISESNLAIFGDNYTNCSYVRTTPFSMVGTSLIIGIIATLLAYLMGIPLGVLMARKKDRFADKLGTIYIVFIMAVPSLAYIFMFSAIGHNLFGLPNNFGMVSNPQWLIYVLPIISLALPSVAGLMKWIRRYMIDQMSSDYVKFARSGGLSEGEIFRKHILKNAAIPIIHGIPGSIIGCVVGGIITESVYAVPGTGKLLTESINKHDNGVIIGLTMFYAFLSVISLILGDILMAIVDPRISFQTGGGKR